MSYSRKMAAGSFMEPARGQWPGMVGPGAATPGAAAGGGISAAALVRARSSKRLGRTPKNSRPATESATTAPPDRKSTRLNSSHLVISYAVFCLKKKKKNTHRL